MSRHTFKLNYPGRACKDCKHVKRLEGYNILAECGLTGMTVNIKVHEVCKYFERIKSEE